MPKKKKNDVQEKVEEEGSSYMILKKCLCGSARSNNVLFSLFFFTLGKIINSLHWYCVLVQGENHKSGLTEFHPNVARGYKIQFNV